MFVQLHILNPHCQLGSRDPIPGNSRKDELILPNLLFLVVFSKNNIMQWGVVKTRSELVYSLYVCVYIYIDIYLCVR